MGGSVVEERGLANLFGLCRTGRTGLCRAGIVPRHPGGTRSNLDRAWPRNPMLSGPQFRRLTRGLLVIGAVGAVRVLGEEPERVVLQLPYSHQFQFAGVYAAMEQGYFREEGLEVELRATSAVWRSSIEEVAAGRADFGIAQGSQLVTGRLEGRPLVVVTAIMQHSPQVLLTRAEDNLNTPHDLIGKRVAMDRTSLQSEIRLMLEREGVGFDRITVVPNDWRHNELTHHNAEAMSGFVIDMPHEMKQAGMPVRVIWPKDYGVDFYGDCLFTSEQTARRAPDRLMGMRRALIRGWHHALQHPDEMIDLILARYPVDAQASRRPATDRDAMKYEAGQMARLINANLVELGRINPGRWRWMAEVIHRYYGKGDPARIEGMIYEPPATTVERLQGLAPWLLWGLAAAVIVAAGTVLTNRRLQSLVERRTAELEQSELRQREYFDLAPAPIVIEDYTALAPALAEFRAAGVTDLRAHLRARRGLTRELLSRKRMVAANRLALSLNGLGTVEGIDRRLADLMTEQAVDMLVEELAAIWEGVDSLTLEKTYHPGEGEPLHMLVNWQMGRRDGQRDLANVRLVFTDVTQQKKAELALRESEARYRELFERAAGGIYRTSPEGHFLTANPALARMFGCVGPEEMIAWAEEHATQSLYVQPGRRDEFRAAFGVTGQLNDFESEVIARDGRRLWISENAREVRDASGRLLYYEGFVTDLTARRQLDAELGRASKLEAVGILAGGIAHDFNNILTVVLGNVTLAEADTEADSAINARLAEARRATLRARDLTLQLLTFAKGGEPLKAAVDLPELLKESAAFALHGARARAEFSIAPDLWPVNADKGQLGQVVQNLVINAVQAMPGGGVVAITAANVELAAGGPKGAPPLAPGRYVRLTVADTGVGIARENLAKIFDPYFTTKALGSGLGLATVYSIIRKHDGAILAESEPGRGTVFYCWLPADVVPATTPAPAAEPELPVARRARVLFMDDEEPIRSMAMIFMDRLGLECETAADGSEALRKYREAMEAGRAFEAVVMDLTVPGGMGGREAMEHLRRLDPDVRVIVSSGYSRDPVMANHRAHGFKAVLPKPYGLEQLRKTMDEVLAARGGVA